VAWHRTKETSGKEIKSAEFKPHCQSNFVDLKKEKRGGLCIEKMMD